MLRRVLVSLCVLAGLVLGFAALAHALGGSLDRPQIAIPSIGEEPNKQPDPTVMALHDALVSCGDDYVGGWFINAHSKLFFRGDAARISSALERLAQVDGAALHVRFSKEPGRTNGPFLTDKQADQPCQWSVEHNGWGGDARALTIVIYVADEALKLEELQLPTIHGRPAPAAPKSVELPAEKQP
ncbi:MAG: hypothetical protein U0836_24795 [Pirellulales bacterium]